MNRTAWLLVIAACLALAIVTGYWQMSSAPPEPLEQRADEPDLYMQDATITQYGADGAAQYRLDSSSIRHFERDNLTRLTAPRFELYRSTGQPWLVRSDHGYIRYRREASEVHEVRTEEVVYLRDHVLLERHADDGTFVTLETEALYIYPDRRFAETDQPVMIDTNSGRTSAVGLEGDLGRGLLKLFSAPDNRIHTIVLPSQFKR